MSRSKSAFPSLKLVGLLMLTLAITGVLYNFSGKSPVSSSPIPPGHVEISVEFNGLSTNDFNNLAAFVRTLAENHTDRLEDDFHGFHGYWNDGFIVRRYKPNHSIPSPEVEQSMAARFESFLKEKGINSRGQKIELRYGETSIDNSEITSK